MAHKIIRNSSIPMACECELLATPEGMVHPLPEGDLDVCSIPSFSKVEAKDGLNYLWLCPECVNHN